MAKCCFDNGIATEAPVQDMREHILKIMYNPVYAPFIQSDIEDTVINRHAHPAHL